jgi:hypothetical protein
MTPGMEPARAAAPAHLYYDAGCGPCTLFARACEWAAGPRVEILPLEGSGAARALSDLDETNRFRYAHLVRGDTRRSGRAIMTPLVGVTLGPTAERTVEGAPPLAHLLERVYDRFWSCRATRGCAAPPRKLVT